jgi:hypothetical protein
VLVLVEMVLHKVMVMTVVVLVDISVMLVQLGKTVIRPLVEVVVQQEKV